MSDQLLHEKTELLQSAYLGFNSRNIADALSTMTMDVAWPRAFKGGYVEGRKAVGAYWTEQWAEISPQVEPEAFQLDKAGNILVKVRQIVRDLAGVILADEYVCHRFTFEQGLIRKMDICPLSEFLSK